MEGTYQKGIGIMLDFSPREYSIRELFDSYNRKETVISPKFQRRPVWEYKAKSYLIDSIISGYPIPRIFIREKIDLNMTAIREIVDGQQRLTTLMLLLRAFYSKFTNMQDENSISTRDDIARCIWKTDEFGKPDKTPHSR